MKSARLQKPNRILLATKAEVDKWQEYRERSRVFRKSREIGEVGEMGVMFG